MKKKLIKGVSSLLVLASCFGYSGCRLILDKLHDVKSKHFIYASFETFGDLSIYKTPLIGNVRSNSGKGPIIFHLKKEGDHLISKDILQFTGYERRTDESTSNELNDWGYQRIVADDYLYNVDRSEERYNKYYIPNMAIYWYFLNISISSENTAFGEDYPPGSDLTPLFTFKFPSLKEFIDNRYKGAYTTEHVIRANDSKAWRELVLFENLGSLAISKLPTAIKNNEKASITLTIEFIDKSKEPHTGTDNKVTITKTFLLDIEE